MLSIREAFKGNWSWGMGHWAWGIDALEIGHAKSGFTAPFWVLFYCPFLVLFVIFRARVAIASVPDGVTGRLKSIQGDNSRQIASKKIG